MKERHPVDAEDQAQKVDSGAGPDSVQAKAAFPVSAEQGQPDSSDHSAQLDD
jgi:hypothetical protein